MDAAGKVDILNRVLHETVNSVVQYIEIAVPYVPAGFEAQMAALRRMREEETETSHRLTDQIAALDGVPTVGVFPYWNVDLNYLDVRYLARLAARQSAKAAAEIEVELDLLRDDARAHALLKSILAQKRAHAAALEEIGKPAPPPAPKKPAAPPAKKPAH